ncbi:hypothetical protein DFH09DRAFT_1080927 [Mycena vulgaris]|nr:hypothetical protein DFH09DRAFT_1080927 [Mycena vulgaris]
MASRSEMPWERKSDPACDPWSAERRKNLENLWKISTLQFSYLSLIYFDNYRRVFDIYFSSGISREHRFHHSLTSHCTSFPDVQWQHFQSPTQESYLVVGGGTLLGETIVDQLLSRGEGRISIFEAQPLAPAQAARFGDAVRVFVGDMSSPESLSEAVQSHSELHKKVNTEGTRNLLAAALDSGTATKIVYVGNADVVFDGRDRPMLREAHAAYPPEVWFSILEPRSHGERMVFSFNGVNALRTAVIRPATTFGPGYATAGFLRRIQANPKIAGIQIGENTNLVDKTYVANAARAAILAADRLAPSHPQHAATAGKAFFIFDGEPRPFWNFTRCLWAVVGGTPIQKPTELGQGTVLFFAGMNDLLGDLKGEKRETWKKTKFLCVTRSYDISLAREVLGYAPIVSHDEGIRRTAQWWLEYQLKICKDKRAITEKSPFF